MGQYSKTLRKGLILIKIFGVGRMGMQLADNLKSLSLSEQLGPTGTGPDRIQFIGVETDDANLECSGADVGFYIGGAEDSSGLGAFEYMRERAQNILSHMLENSYFVLLFVGAGNAMDCAVALAVAELAQARQIVTVSLVGTSEEEPDAEALARLERLQVSSDVLFSTRLGVASMAVNANDLTDCAHTLLRALFLPNQQLVGCDFQDVRTALATLQSERIANRADPNLSFLRLMLDLESINPARIRDLIAPLALHRASRMLIYLEGGPPASE